MTVRIVIAIIFVPIVVLAFAARLVREQAAAFESAWFDVCSEIRAMREAWRAGRFPDLDDEQWW